MSANSHRGWYPPMMATVRRLNVFDYSQDFAPIDYCKRPDLYCIGRSEQGVLLVEPYRSELLPIRRFKAEEEAKVSSAVLYGMFEGYLAAGDIPGADMARKFLQMGWTRARSYANHKGGSMSVHRPASEVFWKKSKKLPAQLAVRECGFLRLPSEGAFACYSP